MAPPCSLHKLHLSSFAIVEQREMDENHLIAMSTLHDEGNVIQLHVLIHGGATSYAFIDEDYAHHHHLPLYLLKSPRNLSIIDERPVT
jgi:hypothetical protein